MDSSSIEIINLTDSFTLADFAKCLEELDGPLSEARARAHIRSQSSRRHIHQTVSDTINIENVSPISLHRPLIRNTAPNANKKVHLDHLTQDKSKQMPIVQNEGYISLSDSIGDCPICLERYGVNPLVSTNCGHVFCRACLEQAIRYKKWCPTCRKILRKNTAYHPLFLGNKVGW